MTHSNCAKRPQRAIKCEEEETPADASAQWQRHKDETKNKTTIYYTTTQRKIQQKSKAKQKTSREFESSNQQQPQHICTYTLLAGWSICKAIITTRKHMYKHTPAALLLQRS